MPNIKYYNWCGGKQRCVNEFLSLIPEEITSWHELCVGSGIITLNKARNEHEFVNDLDDSIYNLFALMSDKEDGKILLNRLLDIKYSEEAFKEALSMQKNKFEGIDKFTKAEMSFVLITQSFNSTRKAWRKGVNQLDYFYFLINNLPEVYKRLQGVAVTNRDCVEILREIKNDSNAGVLLDVPYRHELRGNKKIYHCEMSHEKHIELLNTIKDSSNKIILCGYLDKEDDLYDRFLLDKSQRWSRYKIAELVKSCQNKFRKDIAEEYIWVNYNLPEFSKALIDHSTKISI
ncbi:MAG: DNA adenine methylase [Anaerotignaceae bacterium]